jgi:hypothetical protein
MHALRGQPALIDLTEDASRRTTDAPRVMQHAGGTRVAPAAGVVRPPALDPPRRIVLVAKVSTLSRPDWIIGEVVSVCGNPKAARALEFTRAHRPAELVESTPQSARLNLLIGDEAVHRPSEDNVLRPVDERLEREIRLMARGVPVGH